MSVLYKITVASFLVFFSFISLNVKANNPEYETRRTSYIDNAIANQTGEVIIFQAYKNLPVDQQKLGNILTELTANLTADFDIVKLIRVLCLSNGQYDSIILPVLRPIPFWLEKNEDTKQYWSENHMIMWMSSDWLLHEKYGKTIDSTLEKRLRHYLKLKIQYGFYEFYSSVYAGYCLSGLLNLADFAQDAEIKSLATQASQLLLKDILKLTNDKGVFFPVAGRNYVSKYESAYGQNHNNLIYLLTGMGQTETGSHAGSFLATSNLSIDDVYNSWTPALNTSFTLGHTLQNGVNNINNLMSFKDKVIFQWSSGAYFHPDVATSTFKLLKDLNLWGHYEFDEFQPFSILPTELASGFAETASAISKSSGVYNPTISIFKNKSVTLSSIEDFWKGKVGYQQFPVVANAGTSAVFTISGTPTTDWNDRPSRTSNTHLPYVKQKDNVSLVMYRPEKGLALFGYKDEKLDVSLFWENDKFDEIRESGNWILGREGNGYVAVRRNCTSEINGVRACTNPDGQTWVIMVGNSDMYGSFDAFEQKINQSQYEERWYFNVPTFQWVYYAKIVVDGKTIEYAWNGDFLAGPTQPTGIRKNTIDNTIAVFPNPAKANFNIDLSDLKSTASIKIINSTGQVIQQLESEPNNAFKTITTIGWSSGLYVIEVSTKDGVFINKILVENQ